MKPETTKNAWVPRYAMKMAELTGASIDECVKKADFMWSQLSEDEHHYVSPERCAEDDNG